MRQPPMPPDFDKENPEYYKDLFGKGGTTEALDVIRATLTPSQYEGYLMGNVLKYKLRGGDKGDPEGDRTKAAKYQRLLEVERVARGDVKPF